MIGPIYFVTDPEADLPVLDQALQAAEGGACTVQLRDKSATDAQMLLQIRTLQAALPHGTRLVVNDRVGVAIEAGLWGLHIGQADGDPREIRARIGPDMVLGLSVESIAHLDKLPRDCVDYLGVGPVRATASKPDHATPIGFDGLARIIAGAGLPCVAIGGLKPGDCAAVKAAGAHGMAVVSAIARAPAPREAARALLKEWRET
jgi:thiamine-phosphate pyrophosphorylase